VSESGKHVDRNRGWIDLLSNPAPHVRSIFATDTVRAMPYKKFNIDAWIAYKEGKTLTCALSSAKQIEDRITGGVDPAKPLRNLHQLSATSSGPMVGDEDHAAS
jgi:hypothetical protein